MAQALDQRGNLGDADLGGRNDWFDKLPGDHRARFMQERLGEEVRREALEKRARRAWRRPVGEGIVLFLIMSLPVFGFDLRGHAVCAVAGALVGLTWHICRAGQLLSPIIAMPVCFVLLLHLGGMSYLVVFCAPFPVGCISAWLGAQRHEVDWA